MPTFTVHAQALLARHAAFAVFALAVGCAPADAAVGVARIAAPAADGPITVFYATAAAPATVKRGPFSGSLAIRVKPLLPEAFGYETQYAVGQSQTGTQFQRGGFSAIGSRIQLKGLAVAQWHQIRVRGIGRHGPGDWSNPVRVIVT